MGTCNYFQYVQVLQLHTHTHTPQDGRMAVADTTLGEVAADVPAIGRVSLRTRKTLRGHLAKIYAMHWASDSR